MRVRVLGAESPQLPPEDLARIFPRGLTAERGGDHSSFPRVVVSCPHAVAAVAVYRRFETELRVFDFGVDTDCGCDLRDIMLAAVDGLELACLAGGCRKIVLMPPGIAHQLLGRRGYVAVNADCAGGWMEKTFT